MARNFDHDRFAELLGQALETGPVDAPQRLSQKDFAALVGVNPATVYRWTVGESKPTRKKLAIVAKLFAWPPSLVDDLFSEAPSSREEAIGDFTRWIEITGLRSDFPILRRPAWFDTEVFTLPEGQRSTPGWDQSKIIVDHRGWLFQRLLTPGVVGFPTGQGISTILRAAFLQAEATALTSRDIPVTLSLEDFATSAYDDLLSASIDLLSDAHPDARYGSFDVDPEKLRDRGEQVAASFVGGITRKRVARVTEERLRRGLVGGLLRHEWDRVIRDPWPYIEMLGADPTEAEALLDSDALEDRRKLLHRLLPSAGHDDWSQMEALAPNLVNDELGTILCRFNDVARGRLLLMVDLSPTPIGRVYLGPDGGEHLTRTYLEAAEAIMQAIRDLVDGLNTAASKAAERPIQVIDAVIAAPTVALTELVGSAGLAESREVSPLEPRDLFDMLGREAFRPGVVAPRGGLDDVLDARYVDLPRNCGLSTASWLLRETLTVTSDRRVRDSGDEATAARLGALLNLKPADLQTVARMLELLGFERRTRSKETGRS